MSKTQDGYNEFIDGISDVRGLSIKNLGGNDVEIIYATGNGNESYVLEDSELGNTVGRMPDPGTENAMYVRGGEIQDSEFADLLEQMGVEIVGRNEVLEAKDTLEGDVDMIRESDTYLDYSSLVGKKRRAV